MIMFEHAGKYYTANGSELCSFVISEFETGKFITRIPYEQDWLHVALAALTTHLAIERARNAAVVRREFVPEKIAA